MSNLHDRGTLRGTLQRNSGNYNDLINKPAINGHTLIGNQSGHALGLANEDDIINVKANPHGPATADLHKILVDDTIYSIPDVVVYGTASGAIASFDDGGDNKPLKSLKVTINPVQSGSGDPSPSNVRPISGWDEVKVNVSPTQDVEDGTTYTIQLGSTCYGGELDVKSGELVVDRVSVDLGSLNWSKYNANYSYFRNITPLPSIKYTSMSYQPLCSIYPYKGGAGTISTNLLDKSLYKDWNSAAHFIISDSSYGTATDFKTAMNGVQLVYELATPTEIQLTPTEVTTLLGNNNIWSDTGEITECVYQRDLNLAFNELWDLVHSNSGTRSLSMSKSATAEEIIEEPKEEENK